MTTTSPAALRYAVPDHQGQEVLGAALSEHGYHWDSDFSGGRTHLLITAPDGGSVDREQVRRILAEQHRASLAGPDIIYTQVRFEDEAPVDDVPHHTPVVPPSQRRREAASQDATHDADDADDAESPHAATPRRSRLTVPLARAAVGALLLTFPRAISDRLVPEADEGDRVLIRLLGARHVLQALVSAARPTTGVLAAGAATDALHGATALGYAALSERHRRAALLSATVALGFAASDVRRIRS